MAGRWRLAVVGLVVLLLVAVAGWLVLRPPSKGVVAQCTARAGTVSFLLAPEQAANATTIAAEALRQGLPDHAVSVGLAAALQESKLRNLHYGDRDSLGLFQQRPSQGWGQPAQLLEPRYAAAAFFRGLRRVQGWETMPIYQAAQRVQRSAAPTAYAAWDAESRALAQGLTGEVPSGFSCQYPSVPTATSTTRQRLVTDAAAALGGEALDARTTPTSSRGWLVASWLVSRAPAYSVEKVSFAGWTWTPHGQGWQHATDTPTAGVTYSLRR